MGSICKVLGWLPRLCQLTWPTRVEVRHGAKAVIFTSSIYQPVALTVKSVPSRKRKRTAWPAKGCKSTITSVQPPLLPDHACLSSNGLLQQDERVLLYPPEIKVVASSTSLKVAPPSVENS